MEQDNMGVNNMGTPPAPPAPTPAPVPVAVEPKSTRRGLTVVLVILLVVVCAVAGFFVYKFIDNKDKIAVLEAQIAELQTTPADQETVIDPDADLPLAEQLLKAFREAGWDKGNTAIISVIDGEEIQNSPLAPYQIVKAGLGSTSGLGGGEGYFFREGENGKWQYGFSGNGIPDCGQFSFWKFHLIFANSDCASGEEITTVKEFFNQ